MADKRNRGRGRRSGGDAPGWNASASPGSHGAGGNWRNPSEHFDAPEDWVGRTTRAGGPPEMRGDAHGRTLDNPFGTEPQGWRPEDDYTLSTDRQNGPHRGRGPEGYRRSDERIREDVCDRLTEHGGIDATGIRVEVADGEVTLEGTVAQRVEKWMAEEVADTVLGVQDVHNRIKVRRHHEGRDQERGGR